MVSIHTTAYQDMISLLKKHREVLDLSQRELAKQLGVSQSYISKVESCELRLDIIDYCNYAASLSIDPELVLNMIKNHILYYRK